MYHRTALCGFFTLLRLEMLPSTPLQFSDCTHHHPTPQTPPLPHQHHPVVSNHGSDCRTPSEGNHPGGNGCKLARVCGMWCGHAIHSRVEHMMGAEVRGVTMTRRPLRPPSLAGALGTAPSWCGAVRPLLLWRRRRPCMPSAEQKRDIGAVAGGM